MENKAISLEEAQKIVQDELAARVKKTQEAIQEALNQNNCELIPVINIGDKDINLAMLLNGKLGFVITPKK